MSKLKVVESTKSMAKTAGTGLLIKGLGNGKVATCLLIIILI